MIEIIIEDIDGSNRRLDISANHGCSLMEVLKHEGYDIVAVCGGMALCGTCIIKIVDWKSFLSVADHQELEILDMLPNVDPGYRCSCQLTVNMAMNGMVFKIVK
ncbi:MAG: 2Fe-2S iron-sulfur cluster-binding protein [Mucilaginibacter sp.]|uniref:2Fe-2S iron-sulfur cluster-binding protein n=1 Tax=Mucilaginibacter sp. TaxID=1882438 RepID=UPI0031A3BB84